MTTKTLTVEADVVGLRAAGETPEATGREFSGVAVPWNQIIDVYGMREQFAPASITTPDNGVMVCWRHDEPIGKITGFRDGEAGWEVDGVLSDTAAARDAAVLLRDGVIDRLSIRFEPAEMSLERDDAGEFVTYTSALVREVSLVPFPAYSEAAVTHVRHQQKEATMPTDTTALDADLENLRAEVADLNRKIELGGATLEADANPLHQFDSFGDYVKNLAAGNDDAVRAFEGVVTGDVLLPNDDTTWVGDIIRLMKQKQRIARFFSYAENLPATGMAVEYGLLKTDTTRVAEQVNQGDDLVYGKIDLTSETAKVKTYGGWTEFSRQAIERSSRNVLDLAFTAMGLKFARCIELAARDQLTTAIASQTLAGDVIDLAAFDADTALNADDLLDLLLELSETFDDRDRSLDGLLVSSDVFRKIAHVDERKKALQLVSAPTDKLGTLNIVADIEGRLSNIVVASVPGLPAGTAAACDRLAIKTQVSPGAPFRLQDENIVNLTKQFSVYGYAASYTQIADGIVPVLFGAEAPTA